MTDDVRNGYLIVAMFEPYHATPRAEVGRVRVILGHRADNESAPYVVASLPWSPETGYGREWPQGYYRNTLAAAWARFAAECEYAADIPAAPKAEVL